MPNLKQLTCHIEFGPKNIKLKEYDAKYGDGFVETYVAVPSEPQSFSIHLTSNGYIAPGLAMFVFMDGVHQCNRNRTGLVIPDANTKSDETEIDFRVRQKEDKLDEGRYIGREWTFAQLNTVDTAESTSVDKEALQYIGTIEVIIRRCVGYDEPTKSAYVVPEKRTTGMKESKDVPAMGLDGANDAYDEVDEGEKPHAFGLDGPWEYESGGYRDNYDYPPRPSYRPPPPPPRQSVAKDHPRPIYTPEYPYQTYPTPYPDDDDYRAARERQKRPQREAQPDLKDFAPPGAWPGEPEFQPRSYADDYYRRPPAHQRRPEPDYQPHPYAEDYYRQPFAYQYGPPFQSQPYADYYYRARPVRPTNAGEPQETPIDPEAKKQMDEFIAKQQKLNPFFAGMGNLPMQSTERMRGRWAASVLGSKSNVSHKSAAKVSDKDADDKQTEDQNNEFENNASPDVADDVAAANASGWVNMDTTQAAEVWSKPAESWDTPADQPVGSWADEDANPTTNNNASWGPEESQPKTSTEKKVEEKKVEEQKSGKASGDGKKSRKSRPKPFDPRKPKVKPYWETWNAGLQARNGKDHAQSMYVVPEEPLLQVPAKLAEKQHMSHQVLAGKGVIYHHSAAAPKYIDSMKEPYAVFIFKYRSKEVLEKKLGVKIRKNREDYKQRLEGVSKEEIFELFMKAKARAGYDSDESLAPSTATESEFPESKVGSDMKKKGEKTEEKKATSPAEKESREEKKEEASGWGPAKTPDWETPKPTNEADANADAGQW